MDALFDTIAAVSTPHGEGGVGVIRISGPKAADIADHVFFAHNNKKIAEGRGYSLRLGVVVEDGKTIDDALALLFRAPKSYTGEDVVELQCHGGRVVLSRVLRALTDAGARAADRGEFTRRAFINGRVSLTEAEGVADIISAASKQGEAAAYALSRGSLFRETERIKEELLALQSAIAAWIDFPEEDVEPIDDAQLTGQLQILKNSLQTLLDSYETGLIILRGLPAAIAGTPNVGKSTLMNLLAGHEKAIVTPTAGTTRDVLEHHVQLGGTTLLLADTAGIRESEDAVEKIGVKKALERIEQSDLIFALFDSSRPLSDDDRDLIRKLSGRRVIALINKTDLPTALDVKEIESAFETVVRICATEPGTLTVLDEVLEEYLGINRFSPDMPILMNERQRSAAAKALLAVTEALLAVQGQMTPDVVFISLDEALAAVMELSGENVSDAVLNEVFSRFCVGK